MHHDRKSLIHAAAEFAKAVKGPLKLRDFCRSLRIEPRVIYQRIDGGFGALLDAAGVADRAARIGRVTIQMLLEDVDRVAAQLGHPPTSLDVASHGRFGISTFHKHIGAWRDVLAAYAQWKAGRPADQLGRPPITIPTLNPPPLPAPAPIEATPHEPAPAHSPPPQLTLGPPLGFRGLLHAPTNELGVIHLFGLLAPETGLAVEHIGSAFPDCHALRSQPGGRWRRVAVEFELRSSNFQKHGHDAARCDLIVCWEDDWKDCPVEVIELKEILRKARGGNAYSTV